MFLKFAWNHQIEKHKRPFRNTTHFTKIHLKILFILRVIINEVCPFSRCRDQEIAHQSCRFIIRKHFLFQIRFRKNDSPPKVDWFSKWKHAQEEDLFTAKLRQSYGFCKHYTSQKFLKFNTQRFTVLRRDSYWFKNRLTG